MCTSCHCLLCKNENMDLAITCLVLNVSYQQAPPSRYRLQYSTLGLTDPNRRRLRADAFETEIKTGEQLSRFGDMSGSAWLWSAQSAQCYSRTQARFIYGKLRESGYVDTRTAIRNHAE